MLFLLVHILCWVINTKQSPRCEIKKYCRLNMATYDLKTTGRRTFVDFKTYIYIKYMHIMILVFGSIQFLNTDIWKIWFGLNTYTHISNKNLIMQRSTYAKTLQKRSRKPIQIVIRRIKIIRHHVKIITPRSRKRIQKIQREKVTKARDKQILNFQERRHIFFFAANLF